MTDSRETMRRRQFRERAAAGEPVAAVRLDWLCLAPGCLERRHGANLCPGHAGTQPLPIRHSCPGCADPNNRDETT